MENGQVEVHFSLVTSVVCQLFLCVVVVQLGVQFYLIYSNLVRIPNCRHSCSIWLWRERNSNWRRKLDECYCKDEVDYRVRFFFFSLSFSSLFFSLFFLSLTYHLVLNVNRTWNMKNISNGIQNAVCSDCCYCYYYCWYYLQFHFDCSYLMMFALQIH